ncbi:hypothetical protein [Bacillus sp. Marseille-P3661]|uniref:hypothetical protein n=1 Tax=Bacillus sp. Marseille-P3661 TaxID=1936234 RepID=UPI000C82E100|nr:hypothetical protein [Bacillus sp. Marseille-P3661]
MIIKEVVGYELEKAQPNTSEDFFNRSDVTFEENGIEKTFHLLYLRYFDETFSEFVPFLEDPLFKVEGKEIFFKDIIGLVCMLKNPDFRNRKRVYINDKIELLKLCDGIDYEKLPEVLKAIKNGGYELRSPLQFIKQP